MQTLSVIAHARNGYKQKFGIPRQSGCADSVITRIVFEKEYQVAEALQGIEQWSHLWLIWGFSAVPDKKFSPTVRPPRLGGNKRMGVFATRSPFRPNRLGLSSVRLERVEQTTTDGLVLIVSGADLMDGTPIYDIKPYLPYTDIHPDATAGFAATNNYKLEVIIPTDIECIFPADIAKNIRQIIAEDPRPQYKADDSTSEYGLTYDKWNIHFSVSDGKATITSAVNLHNIQ